MTDNRKWYNVELEVDEATALKQHCREKGYRYSSSECYNLIHIAAYLTRDELDEVNQWIDMNLIKEVV